MRFYIGLGILAFVLMASAAVLGVEEEAVIDIEKFVNGIDADVAPGPTIDVGGTVVLTYVVSNPGTLTITNIVIKDDKLGHIADVGTLYEGEAYYIDVQGSAQPGQQTNIGNVTGTAPDGSVLLDEDPANYFGEGDTPSVPLMPAVAIPAALTLGLVALKRRKE